MHLRNFYSVLIHSKDYMLICIRAPKVDDINLVINQNKKSHVPTLLYTQMHIRLPTVHMETVTEGRDRPSCSGHSAITGHHCGRLLHCPGATTVFNTH